jgi:hypothetical protein
VGREWRFRVNFISGKLTFIFQKTVWKDRWMVAFGSKVCHPLKDMAVRCDDVLCVQSNMESRWEG